MAHDFYLQCKIKIFNQNMHRVNVIKIISIHIFDLRAINACSRTHTHTHKTIPMNDVCAYVFVLVYNRLHLSVYGINRQRKSVVQRIIANLMAHTVTIGRLTTKRQV